MDNITSGIIGESRAVTFLRGKGYRILAQNWRTQVGELDIIAEDGVTLVFVEVKARSTLRCGRPAEAVTPYKQRKTSMVAAQYVKVKRQFDRPVRFDIIELLGGSINHIENAYDSRVRM